MRTSGEISPSFTAVATVTGLVTNSQMVAAASRMLTTAIRVNRLTPTEFEEEVVTTVRPDPHGRFPHGLHTLSAVGSATLIDGKRLVFVPAAFWNEVRKIARRLTGSLAERNGGGPVSS